MKALTHVTLFDLETFKPDSYILFDTKIQEVGSMKDFPRDQLYDECHDLKGQWLVPGFVLGHAHIYSAFARGWISPFNPANFQELLDQLWWKLDAGLDAQTVYLSGKVSAVEVLRNGITTVIDHHASGKMISGSLETLRKAVVEESGLRGIFCFESSDRFPLEETLEENASFAKACAQRNDGRTGALFGLHACMSLSKESLEKAARYRQGTPVHVHVAESLDDQLDSKKRYKLSCVERLDEAGLLEPGALLAHCIHVSPEELAIMKARGVFLALNPLSNMNNGVGLPPYIRFREAGIPVIAGNDGLGFNFGRDLQSFLFAFKHQAQSPLALDLGDVSRLVRQTWDYAGALLNCKLGRLLPGYEADFISLPYDPPSPLDESNALGHWFYGLLDSYRPQNVWCAGTPRIQNSLVLEETTPVLEAARRAAAGLWNSLK